MKIYENLVIGNFLYALGISIGKATAEKTQFSVINLLQQTPDDKLLGDLLIEYPGVVKLIEFKNKKSNLKKEKDRIDQLTISLDNNQEMHTTSKKVHWYIETSPFEEKCFNRIVPYLDAFKPALSTLTIESFIKHITQEVVDQIATNENKSVKNYLQIVAACQGTHKRRDEGSGDMSTGSGGLILCVHANGLAFVQYTNILQLQLQHKQFVRGLQNNYNSIMAPEMGEKQELQKSKTLTRDIGMDYI